jgi:phage terminase large subunit-like protein
LDAEILDDTPGALWTRSGIEATRISRAPELARIVVGVDPSSGGPDGETGIIGCGKDAHTHGYVLGDFTESGDPAVWGPAVIRAFILLRADLVVAEQNQGGALVAQTCRLSWSGPRAASTRGPSRSACSGRSSPRAATTLARSPSWRISVAHGCRAKHRLTAWMPRSGL